MRIAVLWVLGWVAGLVLCLHAAFYYRDHPPHFPRRAPASPEARALAQRVRALEEEASRLKTDSEPRGWWNYRESPTDRPAGRALGGPGH